MGLVVASATFDLEAPPAARGPQGSGGDAGEFAGVLLGRLAQASGRHGEHTAGKKPGLVAQPPEAAPEVDDATADDAFAEAGLPLAVAAWLAVSPVLDPLANAAPARGSGAAPPTLEAAAFSGASPVAPTDDETQAPVLDSAGSATPPEAAPSEDPAGAAVDGPSPGLPGAVAATGEAGLAVAPAADQGAEVSEAPVGTPAQTACEPDPGTDVSTESASAAAVAEADSVSAAVPAPGRHTEQSNRPDALPGDAGGNAVEVLQRVAAKHEEQGKAPPGQQAGGNGMPTVAASASVVRSVGNADTGTSTPGGGSQGEPHGDEGRSTATAAIAAAGPAASAPSQRAVAAAEAAPPPAPVSEPPVEQVGRAVLERVSEGGGEARIRLDPPELGEVAIRVRIENHQVRVDIRVERPEALQLLRTAQIDLSSLLGDRGLNLTGMFTTLSHGRPGSAWGDDAAQQNRRPQDHGFAAILGIDETGAAINQHRKLRGAYNPDGAHDYRV